MPSYQKEKRKCPFLAIFPIPVSLNRSLYRSVVNLLTISQAFISISFFVKGYCKTFQGDTSVGAARICILYACHADLVTIPMRLYNDGFCNVKPFKFNVRYKFIIYKFIMYKFIIYKFIMYKFIIYKFIIYCCK